MLFELAGDGTVLRPVPAVVRSHGELVDEDALVGGLEELDGEHAGDAQPLGHRDADLRRHPLQTLVGAGCRGDDLGAHAPALHGLDDGVGPHVARRSPRHLLGEFAREVDQLLDEQRPAAGVFGEGSEPVVGLRRRRHDAHALPVVPAARGLDHGPAAVRVEELLQLGRVGDGGPVGLRQAEVGHAGAHDELVLRDAEGLGAGVHGDAGVDEGGEHVLRNVLVVEGDDVDVARERQHRVGVAVVADGRGGERRRHALVLREHADLDAQLHGGRDHHPRQLSSTDHSDSQRHAAPSVGIHSVGTSGTARAGTGRRRGPGVFDELSHLDADRRSPSRRRDRKTLQRPRHRRTQPPPSEDRSPRQRPTEPEPNVCESRCARI